VSSIHCAHPPCQSVNPLENSLCEACGFPLVKRYLWAVGDWIKAFQVGELLEERYLLESPNVLLDTLPAQLPLGLEEIPPRIIPYLKLFPLRLHIPLVYSFLASPDPEMDLDVWLLEYGELPLDDHGKPQYPQLFPKLADVWGEASPLRQLIWLKQMVQLWRPLQSQKVVSGLVNPALVCVNGPNIQLLELPLDSHQYHTIKELMAVWSDLFKTAHPAIAAFCGELGEKLEKGKIPHADYLLRVLEGAIAELAENYDCQYQIMTATDTGPKRGHNEDACYPPIGELQGGNQPQQTLTIICDGIGGQDAGEIASQLATEVLPQRLESLFEQSSHLLPQDWVKGIKQAISETNDLICDRNDQENRTERDRMGTTLVMSLARNQELYFANVGDSRLYWITATSCQQMTVDDDLGSREVRLGYELYRNVQQFSHSGSLTQALGIMTSDRIQPSVERVLLEGEGLLLLCSDGLSDLDRIEQYWQTELLPILTGKIDLPTGCDRLITLANEKNGHDNVTISLVKYQIKPPTEEISPLSFADIEVRLPKSRNSEVLAEAPSAQTPRPLTEAEIDTEPSSEELPEETLPPSPPRQPPFWQWVLLCLATMIFLGYTVSQWFNKTSEPEPIATPEMNITPPPPSELPSPVSSPGVNPSDIPSPILSPLTPSPENPVLPSPIPSPP
jgi:protein phosphatase